MTARARPARPLSVSLAALTTSVSVAAADIHSIGPLAGDVASEFGSASLDCTALVGRSRSPSGVLTEFVWTAGQGFRLPPAGLTQLGGVSAGGRFVTGRFNSAAARWDTTTGAILQLPADMVAPQRISGDGRTITGGGTSGGGQPGLARWREGAGVVTQTYDPFISRPGYGPITHDGSVAAANVVTGTGETFSSSGFYWDDSGVRRQLGGSAVPTAVTPDGAYLFGTDLHYLAGNYSNLARWRQDGTYDILIPYQTDRSFGPPVGVDTAGTTLAMNRNVGNSVVPSLWRADTAYERVQDHLTSAGIDLTGWTLTRVQGMSPDMLTFIGEGVNPSGQSVVWYATIPAPPTAGILGLASLLAPRRRRSHC